MMYILNTKRNLPCVGSHVVSNNDNGNLTYH